MGREVNSLKALLLAFITFAVFYHHHQSNSKCLAGYGTVNQRVSDELLASKLFQSIHKPSKVIPFYYSRRFSPAASPNIITLTTIITIDRLDTLLATTQYWDGPISVAMHVPTNSYLSIMDTLDTWIQQNRAFLSKHIDIHIITDNYPRQFNYWRNVARLYAQSTYILMLDVDFAVMTPVSSHILSNPLYMSMLTKGSAALILPAVEFVKSAAHYTVDQFPRSKADLAKYHESGLVESFHGKHNPGHQSTDFQRWIKSGAEGYQILEWHTDYEPYGIFNKDTAPWCDERFNGYGRNKAACWYELYLSGMKMYVVAEDFVIHQRHSYPERIRNIQRTKNTIFYYGFRDEVCIKYNEVYIAENDAANSTLWRNSKIGCVDSAASTYYESRALSPYKKLAVQRENEIEKLKKEIERLEDENRQLASGQWTNIETKELTDEQE